MRYNELKEGDLVYYYPSDDLDSEEWREKYIAVIIKARRLLKTYDILIQTKNVVIKGVDLYSLQKIA